METLSIHHKSSANASTSEGFKPKNGDIVSAKFSEDGEW